MSWTRKIWRKKLSGCLFELGSISFQKKAWLAKIDNYIASYSESINQLEDCGVFEHLDQFYKESLVDEVERNKIQILLTEIEKTNQFEEWDDYHSVDDLDKIWKSNLWKSISVIAADLLLNHFKSDYISQVSDIDPVSRLKEFYNTF